MRLTDLKAQFKNDTAEGLVLVFECPKCQKHSLRIPVVSAPPGGAGGRWSISSLDLGSLTCTPSILHEVAPDAPIECCRFHFNIVSGEIVDAG